LKWRGSSRLVRDGWSLKRVAVVLYTLQIMRSAFMPAASALVFMWAVASAVVVWHKAVVQDRDPIAALDAEFQALAEVLPPSEAVGFLKYHEGDDHIDHLLVHTIAQYALAPRLVLKRNDLEFLIVAPDAARSGGDDRLADFVLVAASPEGYRVYRRRAN
jgi:hypothetical protein